MESKLFDFHLPQELIAQHSVSPRDSSKLLVCQSQGRVGDWKLPFEFKDSIFRDIENLLGPNDLLVVNNAKVLPVRLLGKRLLNNGAQGGDVEALLLKRVHENEWTALTQMSAPARPGLKMIFEPGLIAEVVSTLEERQQNQGEVRLKFSGVSLDRIPLETWLERHGHVPLPPYIARNDKEDDKSKYQTVYAAKSGSAAAPTAGFHFTEELMARLRARGVTFATVTLHVGLGTFRPIKVSDIDEHVMHEETYEISEEFMQSFREAKRVGKRIVAVGTTAVRALESWTSAQSGVFTTSVFIKPGYKFQTVDALITNFHLPQSTLIVLVSAALGSIEEMQRAYAHAIEQRYRFFSYGDAMFICSAQREV